MGVPRVIRSTPLEKGWVQVAAWMAAAARRACIDNTRGGSLNVVQLLETLSKLVSPPYTEVVARVLQVLSGCDGNFGSRSGVSPMERLTLDSFHEELWSSGTRSAQIALVLFDFSSLCEFKGKIDWIPVILRWWLLDFTCLMVDTMKFHTLWLGNRVKVEYTKRKDTVEGADGYLINSAFRRFCLQKLAKRNDRAQILSETFQQGLKRGFPSMKDLEIESSLLDYQLTLQREKPLDHELEHEIRRTAREIFGEVWPDFSKNWQFSLSAGYASTRGEMGQRGEIVRWAIRSGILSWTTLLRPEFLGYEELRTQVREVRGIDDIDYLNVWLELRGQKLPTIARSRVAVVREPLKIRPITAGPSLLYGLAKPFQQALWKSLQKFAIFRLTGEEYSWRALHENLIPRDRSLDWFISGDYSGATNEMAMMATRAAWETAFHEEHWDIVEPMLGAHLIELPNTTFIQKNGQLMGSPLSFPILCCVNAAVARRSYELYYGRQLTLHELPCLVNGDDFAGASNHVHHEIWKDLVRRVGWRLSPGKSYFSRDFVQINSRTAAVVWTDLQSLGSLPLFRDAYPFWNFGYIELMSKDVKQLDEPLTEDIATGWEGRLRWMRQDKKTFAKQFALASRNLTSQIDAFVHQSDHRGSKVRLRVDLPPCLGGLFFTDCLACSLTEVCDEHGFKHLDDLPSHVLAPPRDKSHLVYVVDEETPFEPPRRELQEFTGFKDQWRRPMGNDVHLVLADITHVDLERLALPGLYDSISEIRRVVALLRAYASTRGDFCEAAKSDWIEADKPSHEEADKPIHS